MKKALAALATAAALITTSAAANDLVIIFNDLNPTPKAAFEKVVNDFKAANPDINVELSINDREAHKPAIRNFLSAGPPDVTAWYPGNRMGPFVDAGLMEDLSGLWASDPNLSTSFEAMAMVLLVGFAVVELTLQEWQTRMPHSTTQPDDSVGETSFEPQDAQHMQPARRRQPWTDRYA